MVDVVAVCDLDRKNALEASQVFGVKKTYGDLSEIPEKERPEIIDICTPPSTHADIVKEALEIGCHCFLEKPMTVTVKDADEIIKISRERDLRIFVLHNYSYLPCIRKTRKLVSEGKVGKLVLVETRYLTSLQRERFYNGDHWIHKLPGGILNSELLPHLLMLVLDFVGYPLVETKIVVNKITDLPYIPADELRMNMLSPTNALGYVGLSFNSPVFCHTLDVIGERGGIFVDHLTQSVVYREAPRSSSANADSQLTNPVTRGSWAFNELTQKLAGIMAVGMNTALGRYKMMAEGHRYLFEEGFKALNGESQYPVDLQKCREVVRMIEKVYECVSLFQMQSHTPL
jgi:predicted dehydrogenase